jgi:hypothetical protein
MPGSTYSWQNLIENLISFSDLNGIIRIDNKPFPLLYEEIYLNAIRSGRKNESELKQFIATETTRLRSNIIHSNIMSLNVTNILTTNYDLLLEYSTQKKGIFENAGLIKENTYNLFRCHSLGSKNIWHIHGCENTPKSITLGYEHYSGYLQQMRNYLTKGTGDSYQNKTFHPLWKRYLKGKLVMDSWVDAFFMKDIHILGLNMDFVEIHLWWLLTFRARVMLENKYPINNRIYYYYPKELEVLSKTKLEMLKAVNVQILSYPHYQKNKLNYYQMIINDIKKQLR